MDTNRLWNAQFPALKSKKLRLKEQIRWVAWWPNWRLHCVFACLRSRPSILTLVTTLPTWQRMQRSVPCECSQNQRSTWMCVRVWATSSYLACRTAVCPTLMPQTGCYFASAPRLSMCALLHYVQDWLQRSGSEEKGRCKSLRLR